MPKNSPRDDWFQTIRQIESSGERFARVGHAARPAAESVRIGQPADLDFAPASVSKVTVDDAGHHHIRQRSFGLLGPAGPMPLWLTQTVRDRTRDEDPSLEAFLNLFHHRMATLFYRAWASSRGAVQRDRPGDDRMADWVGALAGAIGSEDSSRTSSALEKLRRDSRLHFVGRHGPVGRSAEALAAVVSATHDVPVRVESFRLRRLPLPVENQTQLGGPNRQHGGGLGHGGLGHGAVVGRTIADRASMIGVSIGPLRWSGFDRLRPGGEEHQTLVATIGDFIGPAVDADVELSVVGGDVRPMTLGRSGRLGIDAWVSPQDRSGVRRDSHFTVCGAPEAEQ